MFTKSSFSPAWWLKNAHLQTIAAKFFRRGHSISTTNETLELPDGDFVDLAWTEQVNPTCSRPIVAVLHGLEGSKNSHYAKGMLSAIKAQGWVGVLMHFRGCSGRPNRMAKSYHSGQTCDVDFFSQYLASNYPQAKKAIIGFSLGGNVLTRYLAEQKENIYQAACVICAPLDLSSCSNRINRGFSRVYQKYLVDMLRASTIEKINANLLSNIDRNHLNKVRSIRDFDQMVTAPINGFLDANDYYRQSSGREVLKQITTPCLIIHATDDPFLCHVNTTAISTLPKQMIFEVSARGGHVGFISGKNPLKPQFWLEQRIPEFFKSYL
ncbi:hydrolase [Cognaticolwellia beringensis]|uniref:Hydrolase n=1 Tax=Cognaticolwellia beringensis TaxID=1967665 RepID=A0A222G8E4_9GAMM|nr:hydrolase [Cognaticolwellia beringensis]ASP48165.1 hydrolase [Cognaticolwellia beringensis]